MATPWMADTGDIPAGFEIPLCRAALKPKLLAGAPRDFSIVMMMLVLSAFLFKMWPLYPVVAVLQGFAVVVTSVDPHAFVKAWRVARQYAQYYKP